MNKFDTFYESIMNESRRTPEETERLQRNLERYQYLMSAQEQGEGDYFDWSEFEDYSDYEDEIEALEKEAEANGYLDQLKRNADSDVRRERRDAHMNDDPLEDKAYQVKDHRLTKAGKLNKQDVETMKKGLKGRRASGRARYSVKGMEKPNLPEDSESMDAGDDFDKEPIEMIESHMAKVNLNLGMAGEIAADAASPGVDKRAGELGAEVQRQLHDFMDNFGPEEDAESSMEDVANITGELNGRGRMAAETITSIFALVEDEGKEMLDKQAAEKLEDIIELASNALRELNNRLD